MALILRRSPTRRSSGRATRARWHRRAETRAGTLREHRGEGIPMVDISGRCPPGYGAVRDAFAENFEVDGDVGASVAVTLDGELVVDLWGGTQDVEGTVP